MWKWFQYLWFKIVTLPKMEESLKPETINYGGDKTIHDNTYIDIETDSRGEILAVYFRCLPLPFKQHKVKENRAEQLRSFYGRDGLPTIQAIEVDYLDKRTIYE